MWKSLISLAHRAGFTRNEAAVALFLGAAILFGIALSAFRQPPQPGPDYRAEFAKHDSLFAQRASLPEMAATDSTRTPHRTSTTVANSGTKRTGGTVNINTAGAAELQSLPGVGEATATKIVTWRTAHGRFSRPEDIMNVPSIGEKKFEKMRHLITVE
ncbi:MAG: ComEA family DNA-binding protein [Bacteroidia bacterium]|nr:ComEA family DNA-binding protein [Bacteroidia bacterium]